MARETGMKAHIRAFHAAVIDLMALMNRPERDDVLLNEAGVALDRALFPLVSGIERFGPVGVVDLAAGVGRDYTTVSRQVAKLEALGLVERKPGAADARVHEAVLTKKGRRMTEALAAARVRLAAPIIGKWNEKDFATLVRLLRRLVDDMTAMGEDREE
jgi:DNA-binding MarR family transcriptional regulator